MAARKPVQDLFCMFCGDTPCSCDSLEKKSPPKKATKSEPVRNDTKPDPGLRDQEVPKAAPQKRASLSSLSTTLQVPRSEESDGEREALTNLVRAGFMVTKVGDPKGFETIRPKLNMSPVEIDIALWKIGRKKWQSTQANTSGSQ